MAKETLAEQVAYLEKRSYWLECMKGAGVDNWEGMEYANEEYFKKYPEDE